MKRTLSFIFVLLFAFHLNGQELPRVINGYVLDQSGQALANKKVEARYHDCNDPTNQELIVESVSNEEGYYELEMELCSEQVFLVIAYCGEGFQSVDFYSFYEDHTEINFDFDCNFDYNCDASFSYTFGEPNMEDGVIPFYFEAINPNNEDYFYEWAFLGAVDVEGDGSENPEVNYPTFGQYSVCLQTYITGDPYNPICEFCETINSDLALASFGTTSTKRPTIAEDVRLSPNPTTQESILALNILEQQNYTIEITNHMGQTLFQNEMVLIKGRNQITLDLSRFANGIYMVQVKSPAGQLSRKIVKY